MAGTISFSGLSASGLDTSSWVDALVSVKQQTITSLEQQKAEKENLLSIVNNIKSYFSSFQTCLQKITDSQYGIASMDLFMQNLALSSNSSIATATATTEAARQSYDVAVDSLATATKATSGYSQIEVKTADLNTTFGTLGGKNGTITVNSQSFNVTTEDTLQNLIDKFKNVGVDAKFDENKGTFTIGMDLDKIDEGATNLKNALRLANNNVSGAVSGSVVYANRNTEFYKLGLNGGDINIEGVKHTITKNGNDYTIQKDGGTAVQMNTLGEFLDYLKSSAVGADDATVDAKGHITIKGATLDKVEGGTNLIDVLNLIESQKRTVSESGALSYIEVRVADLNTKLSALGITGDTTLVAGGTNNTISNDKTLGDIKNILKNAGVDMSVDSRGIITIDTHGNEISGTLLDVLNLDPTKGGTTISSSVHQATLKADGNTKLSELGISSDKKYTAYKSDGTALTTEISNVEGQTVNEFVNALKNSGLDAKFDEKTHQITIKDGYIEGSLADALGMTQLSTSFTENASLNTQLEKLGAIGDSTLTIDGGTAKTYGKDTTLETVFNDIKNAGGKVTFKDGNVTIEGVTLGGSLPSLLGLDATTQGTSVTSGKLTAVTGSTSSGGNTESTVEHNIELSTKLGDITGTTSNYTLKVGDGASTTYTKDSTLQDIKTQIEAAGGKFTINDDNTISIEGVTMSGTVVGALGFDELATGTKFTTVDAVMISGTSNVATGDTTLGNLGLVASASTSGARAVRRAPAAFPNKTLSINGGATNFYGADASLDDIFADIVAAGGTASINSEGYIVIDGVHLEGTLVDALGLVETSYKTTITSGELKVTTSTKSTSSSALYTDTKGDIAWDSTIGSIVGDTNSYDLKVNGTNKTYNTNTKLSDIKNVIQTAGGTMTINDDNTISINGVEISGSLVDKLGFNSDGVHTVVSSNNPIYYSDGKKSADTGTTFEQLGIGADKRDYAIYKNDGTVVKASSTNGTNSGKTIGDWLKVVNDSLNTANGTSGITYASINNGVISITGGYVTGSLPTELGIGTKETVTGITMEGSSVSYVEYDPLKYIGNTQTGSGIAGGTMVTSGFMTEAMQYKDELGNIHAVTETTKLSEVLDTSGNKIGSGSYTFNVGSYTKTFDADSTTLGDIVNYVNNLNMDTTHDTTTSATLVDGKLTIESNVSIIGTLLDKLGFEKQDVSTVAYEIKGTQKAHYKKSDGVTVTATTSTTIKELMGKGGEQAFSFVDFRGAMPFSRTIMFAETDTIQTVIDKLKEFGFDEVDLVDGVFRIKDDKKWSFYGSSELVNKLFGGDDRTYSAEGPKVTYQVTHSSIGSYTGNKITYTTTTTGSAGSVTGNKLTYTTSSAGSVIGNFLTYTTTTTTSGKTYSGDVVNTVPKGYSTDTKLVDIDSSYNGSEMYVYKKQSSWNKENEKVKTLTIDSNTTIQDVIKFYKPYLSQSLNASDASSLSGYIYSYDNGTLTLNFQSGYSSKSSSSGFLNNNKETISFGTTTPTVATTSTKLYELETSPSTTANIKVVNNGKEYSFEAGSVQNASPTIQDVLDFLNNTVGCTATFTDGKLTVSGASDLEFKKPSTTTSNGVPLLNYVYDMSVLFGGNMPTSTPSVITTIHDATGSTKMSELGITDFTVNGSALSGITSNSTINDVLAKLKSTYGLSEATFSDGKITLKSNSNTTLSGNLIKGLMGKDSVSITAGLVAAPASKTGNKVTYSATKSYSGLVVKTAAKGYSTDTKLVDIDSKYQGSEMYVYKQNTSVILKPPGNLNSSGTSGKPLKPLENQETSVRFDKVATLSIDSNTTIQNVIDFYEPYLVESSSVSNPNYTYSLTDGTLTLKFQTGYSLHGLLSSSNDSNDTISFGTTTPTVATTSTKLSDLEISPSDFQNIELVNNGKKYSLDVRLSYQTTIQDVLDFLNNTAGCTATFTDGKLTVTGASDLEFKKPSTTISNGESLQDDVYDMSVLFGGSIPTGTTTTHTATDSTKMFELGLSPTLKVDGKNITGLSSSSTVGQVLSALKSQYGIDGSISDGKMTLTSSSAHTVSGDVINKFFGSDSISLTPTTTSTGGTTTTHTATGSTKMSELGITDFKVNGSALSGITSSSTINDVLAKLKSTYGLSEATITDGKITFKSNSSTTLSGNLIKGLTGKDSVNITATAGTTTIHTATGSTTLAQLGVTDFKVNGSALSGITSSSTINDVLAKLKSTYNLSEATISDGKVTLKSNGNTTLSGNLINRLTGQDSVSLTAKSSKTCSGDVVKTAAKGYSTGTKLVDINSRYKGKACTVSELRTVIDNSGSIARPDITPDGSGSSSGGNLNGNSSIITKPNGGSTKLESVEIAKLTINENTTIQDVIDFYNNYGTCSYSEETGDISTSPNKNYSFFHPFNMSEAGKFNIGKTTPKTATTSTTLGELDSSSLVGNNMVVVNNGNEYTFATSKSTTIQDVLDFLNNTAGCTATFTDGKLTVTGGSDLEFKTTTGVSGFMHFCYQMSTLFGGNMTTSTTSSTTGTITTTYTADTTTKLGASGLGLTSFDLQIEPLGDAEPISISGLNGDSTIGDVFKKLAEKGITASMNNGVITLTSNTEYSLSGTIAKKLFGNDIVDLECKDEIHDFSMTQVSDTKYQYVSRNLTANSGPERVSEVSQLVAGNKYHISSAEDLVALANFVKNGADTTGSIFMFDNDIDMSGVTGFTAIGTWENAFKGTVYGNGHVVNNMTIDAASSPFMGLFGYTNQATIKDIGVINANVTGGAYTGILVGKAENSQISNAYTSGTITGTKDQIGGLAGEIKNSTATNVYSTADVKGNGNVGGLVGISSGSVIEKAFATGKATATTYQAGGLIGAMINGGTVKNSYSTGDVNGVNYDGGFVGLIEKASITYTFDTVYSTGRANGSDASGGFVGFVNTGATVNIKNAVYNRSTGVDAIGLKAGTITGNISGKDYEQMIQKSVMQNAGFTEDKGWVYSANSTPIFGNTTVTGGGKTYLDSSITSLTSGSTYYISTLEQLNNLATLVNNGADTSGVNFVLDNDIDVSSFTNPISDFKGTFYGNGHSLTGLKMALFGRVTGNAIVRDLALENMSAQGLLASVVSDNSTVDNVYSTGSTKRHAGLISTLEGNATLKNSYSTANVTTTSLDSAGGLVGSMSDNATIEHCFAKNTITQKTNTLIPTVIGGLVGDVSGGTIKSSYADCVIKAPVRSNISSFGTSTTGGLIGKTSGDVTVENCYATGSRTAEKTDMFIGQNDGNVTSSGNVACTGTIFGIGTTSGFSDGVAFVSNPELNSQARMEELGFTKDKGWVYYSGKAPMLQGKDTSSAGTEHQIDTKSTLDSICKNRENKTLTVTINGETHSKTFKGSDTVRDVANWLNGIDGVTANVSNSKFNVSGASQDFRVDGELADVLFGNNKTTTNQTITENTDSNGLMVDGGQKKIDNNTTVGQLLGVTSGKYAIIYIDDSGNLQSEKFSSDEKLSEVLKYLNNNGFQASIVNGVFTATKDGKIATNISGAIGEKLKGENGTVTNTSSGYKTGQLDASSSTKATATTKLSDLGIASGSIFIKDNNNNTLGTIQIDNSMTIDDTAQLLANYGFTLGITDGKVTIEGNGTNRIADGTSNLVSQMKLNNWIETKDKLKTDSTVAQMGFGKGSTLGLVIDNKTYNLTFDANATLQDIIDTLGTYGVTASVDNNGKFTASASGNLVLTNELGAYLTKNSAEGYVKEADGYKSKDPLEFKGDKVKLDYDSKVGDILGTGKDGVLRLTLNKDTVVDLTYKADDTMADIIADLKGYGITATIDDGVLKATSNDKTFRLSGEIGKIISGDTPQYDDISTGYVSKDLSYETTNKTNMNNTLKEMGVSSGQIHVLSNDGKIVSTLDVDENYTVAQVKSLLQPFGMTLSVDENGKFTVASAEGYKLSDGTSNMVSKMGLNNWTTSTEKLSGATTLAQMGFKDGADLNLFLDGAVMNVLSFDANQTVDDIIFGLAAYGIDASVNADGQFTATSKSHTFIMSGGLGSYLTKGTGGYVNSDTAYESYKPLVESKDYVETASKGLDYKDIMTEGSTLESLGFAQGGTVRVMLDGKTPYTLQFLATDKVQDVIYALSAYGINAEVKDGRFVAESVNNTFTLTGNLGSYFVEGGAYQNEVTGYESKPLTYETTEKLTNDTKLSDLGITRGDINVIKDGKVADTIHISDNTTIGQLFSAIKPYGMTGEIVTKANGDTSIRISADSDIKLADGTSNVVSGLGLQNVRKGDFEGMKKYWDDDATSGLITEDTLLSTLDRNGFIAQGSLIFNTGEGDDAVQHIINISANETVGSLLKKFNDSGIKATLDDGVIKLTGGLDKLTFTGGTSGLVETIGLDIHNIDKYASSSSALTYEGETHYSASNFANANTKLDIVNATDGNMSIFVDGVKCNIEVKSSDSFADLFKKIKDTVKARTGLDIQAGFKTKDGSISANPTDANNTGIIGLEIEKGHELVVGASNDTTNFATIANLNKTDYNAVTGSRALYRVNVNSLITESGLYRDGDITEGTFKIGDAEFTIDSTTTLASLINQINKNDKAYANAYWDTLAGTLVIESTVTGASLINIEAGTSNFTDIMGFTKTKDGVSALVTDSQTLGQNAVVRINGTTVTSATNVITSDISKIKGLTINLKNVSAGETVTISVEQDKEAIYNAVSDTLDAYNSMMEALGKELADKKSLGGESILKLMRNNLKRLMTSSLTGAYVFKNLASVGISTGEASDKITTNVTSLLIDKDKFMDALNTDSDAVQDLLVGTKANPGIFLQANNIVENSINTDGYFSNMANTLTKSINNIEKKISKNNLAIENYRTKLETKFHNMELTISGLQSAYANILK